MRTAAPTFRSLLVRNLLVSLVMILFCLAWAVSQDVGRTLRPREHPGFMPDQTWRHAMP